MAENPKLEFDSSAELGELEDKMDAQKITVSDHMNGFEYSAEKSDSFVIDMESVTPTSRITRSLSRKGSPRVEGGGCGVDKKTNSNIMTSTRDGEPLATSSPKAAATVGTPSKLSGLAVGTTNHFSNPQVHHQITITANNMSTNAESKLGIYKNSFRRRSQSWFFDPKKILMFFATLSSMGTILLIYFTLKASQLNEDDSALDWQP